MSGRRSAPTPAGGGATSGGPGRRTARGRRGPDLTTVLAVLVPVLVVLALLVGGTEPTRRPSVAPEESPLTRSTLICPEAREAPGAGDRDGRVLVATTGEAAGEVTAGRGDGAEGVRLRPGRTADVTGEGTVPVTATGDLAPNLVASRVATGPLAAAECLPGTAEAWFTGVGAGARHSSVLELANPGSGQAVVDVRVLGRTGPVEADDLLGVVVRGGETVRIDLARTVPRRDELALQVVTTRGRVSAAVLDEVDRLGRSVPSRDWLAPQAEPTTTNTLVGVPPGAGRRELVLANGGEDEVRAELRLLAADATFVPEGLEEVRVPPGGVTRVSLSGVLGGTGEEEAHGLQVDSSGPLTATVRSVADDDLTHAVGGHRISGPAAVLLPRGAKELTVSGADGVGVVVVEALDAEGRRVREKRLEVAPDRTATLDLPADVVQVRLRPERATVSAAVLVTGDGVAAMPVREPVRSGLVPDVHPALP